MNEQTTDIPLAVASVTDRGLSEKRPLNEDSLLVDATRRIFAVADGVGGAEAGEVASQTAIEVIEDAFGHHQPGDDLEDLMEIAIQRANSSIHQMSREHPKLSMMATTIVALHLEGHRATIGHVGDSRLYRISPDGQIMRETDDHSVVEEEVRAGRMTPEQAVNHPSRNVISRALGAEAAVEVDLKTLEVEDGTGFLLCSDGITRHLPDDELREILGNETDLEAACAEMKRRCFERGAEDNLTAVVVRIGGEHGASRLTDAVVEDDEQTLITERAAFMDADTLSDSAAAAVATPVANLQRPFDGVSTPSSPVVEQPDHHDTHDASHAHDHDVPRDEPSAHTSTGRAGRTFGLLLFLIAASALAFYAGTRYTRWKIDQTPATVPPVAALPSPSPSPQTAESRFEQLRRSVDGSPAPEATRMANELAAQPSNAEDPLFLYFYGRSLLLSGKPTEAVGYFQQANARIDAAAPPLSAEHAQLRNDALLATVTAALKSNNAEAQRGAMMRLESLSAAQNVAPPLPLAPVTPQGQPPSASVEPTAPLP